MKKRFLFLALAVTLLLGGCTSGPTATPAYESQTPGVDVQLTAEPSPTVPDGNAFTVHFIDVGQADSALVLCDGQAMLIDGGNAADSDLIYTYLKNHGVSDLDYMVCTHAHEDHVGGLPGALNYASVGTVYCPVTEYDSRAFDSFVKYTEKQGRSVEIPRAGDTFSLGSASVTVLGPVREYEETNDTSIVLRIVYGETSFLFTGDAEAAAEHDVIEAGAELESTVLKVGHHGSSTSTSYPFLRAVAPQYAVISCGKDNSYGHPHEETRSKLRDADVTVYRTDRQGTIIATSDGHTVVFTTERNQDGDMLELPPNSTQTDAGTETAYVVNTNTKKFHLPSCGSVDDMKPENRQDYTGTKGELIAQGYSPCGRCLAG